MSSGLGHSIIRWSDQRTFDRTTGWKKVVTYVGLPAAINSIGISGNPLSIEITPEPPYLRKTATFSTDGNGNETVNLTETTWELDWNAREIEIFNKISAENAALLKQIITEVEAREKTYSEGYTEIGNLGGGAAELNLYSLYFNGTRSYLFYQPVLRKSMSFDPFTTVPINPFLDINKMHTPAQLGEAEPTVDDQPIALPTTGYWLKKPPRVTSSSTGSVQMFQEWEWVEEFSQYLYQSKA